MFYIIGRFGKLIGSEFLYEILSLIGKNGGL